MNSLQRCSACGRENTADAVFCIGCGQLLVEESVPEISLQICPACGRESAADAMFCVGCGWRLADESAPVPARQQPAEHTEDIDDHLMWSVLATVVGLLCFAVLPAIPAAVAVMHAIRVGDQVTTGDIEAARHASEEAEKWLKWAGRLIPVGLVIMFVLVLMVLF